MTFHLIFDNNNMAGVTCGAGTAYPSGTSEFVPSFRGVSVVHVVISHVFPKFSIYWKFNSKRFYLSFNSKLLNGFM
jgi:hypothetical protein